MTPGLKLVILDRDGTINEDRDDFVKSADEWVALPGALEAIARLNHAGWHAVIATNQSGIGRGLFDMAALNAIHLKMNQALHRVGGRVDAVFFCPHVPQDGCNCRKPAPGLFEQIAERYGIALRDVPAVGDSPRDIEAGHAAGCKTHLLRSGKLAGAGPDELAKICARAPGSQVHADLAAFAEALIQSERAARSASGAPASGYGHLE